MKLNKETYEKIIHSKEFKNWFGDWQHPNSKTSKNVFNVDCNVLKIDSAKIKGEHVWLEHAICVETEHHLVIDTQLWQEFNNNTPDDLDKRKVIFDWEEYNEIVTILDSSLWYTTNEKE